MPLVQRSDASRWQESFAESAAPSAGMSESGSVVSASTRPAPTFTTAQSCPMRGPTSTSGRAAASAGAITRSNSACESLPSGGAAVSVERRPIGDRVEEQPLGAAPEQAERDRAREHDHVAAALGLVHRVGRALQAALGLGPGPAAELERGAVERHRVGALLRRLEEEIALHQHRDPRALVAEAQEVARI